MYLLSQIDSMPKIEGLDIPKAFYWVFDEPAPLAGMRFPFSTQFPWEKLHEKGFDYVVNLAEFHSSYECSPLSMLECKALQDLYGGGYPNNPKEEKKLITKIVTAVEGYLNNNQGVIVHCLGGRGRTGTVLGCIIKKFGYNSNNVIHDLCRLHKHRGKKDGWPESEWQAGLVRSF